ncbi:hypothetical protein STEG23_030156, partial [Scotinomys teguina]
LNGLQVGHLKSKAKREQTMTPEEKEKQKPRTTSKNGNDCLMLKLSWTRLGIIGHYDEVDIFSFAQSHENHVEVTTRLTTEFALSFRGGFDIGFSTHAETVKMVGTLGGTLNEPHTVKQ